jgi:hypothetical protein
MKELLGDANEGKMPELCAENLMYFSLSMLTCVSFSIM